MSNSYEVNVNMPQETFNIVTPKYTVELKVAGGRGKSAYEVAVKHGFVGTEDDWLASLVGPRGAQGIQGIQGVQGEKGDKGDQGIQGIQGEKGDKGDTGSTGAKGDKGDKGDTGSTGEKGDKGDKGDTGSTGAKGDKGDTGNGISSVTLNNDYTLTITFTNGTTYTTPSSIRGVQGEKGDKGDKGDTGSKGDTGGTGKGISSITLNNDYTLTITFTDGTSTTTSSVRGPQGEKGDTPTVTTGTTDGTINVDGTDVAVKSLGTAAYTSSTDYAAASHEHTGTELKLTGYSKPASTSAIVATDTANDAIGKLEKALDGKQASGTYVSSVASGTTNGTISVDNVDVAVTGLGSAAFTEALLELDTNGDIMPTAIPASS